MIYLDHNATTMMPAAVIDAMAAVYRAAYANPASQHAAGREARSALDKLVEQIGDHLGARRHGYPPDRVVLTSGGTEANNLAIRGFGDLRCT